MQNSSAFQFLAIDTIFESTTNPRRTFDQGKLYELAESIKHNGMIQPITVRPKENGFEIVAGARRYRAAQLADLFSVPARIVEIDDAQALEWQLVENSQRVDVHPYEEAQGFQRLLDLPGYDVAAIAEKSGKSTSHVYARLSLLQLIPAVAEALRRSASPPAMPISSHVFRKSSRQTPLSSAGARTGRTRNRTFCQPSTFPLGYRPISICPLRMRHSTRKIKPLTRPQDLAPLAPVAADTTLHSLAMCRATSVSYVESEQPQVFSAGSLPPRILTPFAPPYLFLFDLQKEVYLPFEFVVHPIRWDRCPLVAADPHASSWLTLQSHRGLALNTLDAYSRALERYLAFLKVRCVASISATRGDLGLYLAALHGGESELSNATVQQLLTVVRLFHAYLMEEGVRPNNPAAQTGSGRGIVARHHKLPWIPNEEDWHSILASARQESIRNRAMLAFAYDAGLRREELCSLESSDIDPARRMLRIRAESTKGRRERVLPYSASSGELLLRYLEHRRALGKKRGPLFLSESRRNYARPISIWSWSKIVLQLARRAGIERFSTHTLRHLCLTDLARAGWDIHEIASFAGHRSVQTTLLYIHLSGRDLSLKLAASMAQIHARRAQMLSEVGQ